MSRTTSASSASQPRLATDRFGALPPAAVARWHRPELAQTVLDGLMNLVRHPVRRLPAGRGRAGALVVLELMRLQPRDDGCIAVDVAQPRDGGIDWAPEDAERIVLIGMPWRDLWLREHEARWRRWLREQAGVGETHRVPALEAWIDWLFTACRRALLAGGELRALRARIRAALAPLLQPLALRRAALLTQRTSEGVRVGDYNLALRQAAALDRLDAEAPQLRRLYGSLCRHPGFTATDQPVRDLRRLFEQAHLSPRTWRLALQGDARLLAPLARFYSNGPTWAAVEHLRLLDAPGWRRQPPHWLIEQWLSVWGHDGNRRTSYIGRVAGRSENWQHVARLVEQMLPDDQHRLREELLPVLRWLEVADPHDFVKGQRQAGWPWLLRQARGAERRSRMEAANRPAWPVPVPRLAFGGIDAVPLALRHCAANYADRCRSGECLLVSLREPAGGRRLATADLRPLRCAEAHWHPRDLRGFANAAATPALQRIAEALARRLPALPTRRLTPRSSGTRP